jgi:hypothetical protein
MTKAQRWSKFVEVARNYLGINGGGGWGKSQWDGIDNFDISGGLIGGTIGYNWQFGQVVVGAEGDVDWSSINGTTVVNCVPGCSTRNDWLATVRGRLGVLVQPVPAVPDRRACSGRYQCDHAWLSGGQHHQGRLDGRSWR